jgi:hypothetical protein
MHAFDTFSSHFWLWMVIIVRQFKLENIVATQQFNNGKMHMCFEVFMVVIVQILSPWLLYSAAL